MKQTVVALSALFISVLLFASGNGFVNSLLGVRLSLSGISPIAIGGVLFFFSLGFVAGTQYAPGIIQRVGHIRAFAVFSAVLAITALAYPLTSHLAVWASLRLISGVAAAGLLIAVESWFNCVATESNRATLFATYQLCFYSAVAGGQLLMQLAPPDSPVPFSIAAMLLVASLIPLAASQMHSPVLEITEHLPLRRIFRESPLGIIAAVINGILMSSFYSMGPVYATLSGHSVGQISIFMASGIFSAMLLAWPIGHFCDHHHRSWVLLGVSLCAALASGCALLIAPFSFPLLCALTALYLGLAASIYTIAVAITIDRMTLNEVVATSASMLLAYGIGSLIGPLLTSGVMSLTAAGSFYLVNIGLLAGLVLYLIRDLRKVPPIPIHEQESYVTTLPGITQTITEIDPRNEDYDETSNTLEEVFVDTELAESDDQTSSGT